MEEETITCNECSVEFTIVYEAIEGSPTVCPFCANSLSEEEWDEDTDPYSDAEED
jgi:hypothetical protein